MLLLDFLVIRIFQGEAQILSEFIGLQKRPSVSTPKEVSNWNCLLYKELGCGQRSWNHANVGHFQGTSSFKMNSGIPSSDTRVSQVA